MSKIFLDAIASNLTKLTCKYQNIMVIGDFSLTLANKYLGTFNTTFTNMLSV